MKYQIIIVFLVIILVVCSINYMIDFFFYLKNRYCKFHIGRYANFEEWNKAVEKKAVKWLKKTPTVKITDNSRYMLLDFISGRYRSHTIQSWQKAALILGLIQSRNSGYRKQAKNAALNLLDKSGSWKNKPRAVDCGMISFAVLKAIPDSEKIKPAMDESIAIIKKNINKEGMISYTGGKENPDMYVDTLGLVCPFLVLYARKYHVPEYEKLAFKQLKMFHKYGLYKGTALPNHAFEIKSKLPLGVYGWGRGTAWYLIGLMDSYNIFEEATYKSRVRQWLIEAAEFYLAFQRPDGGFGSILQRTQTYDSSVTAVMSWFYAKMYEMCKKEDYSNVSKHCREKLLKCTRISGAIDECQGDTKDIGVFAQTYDIMPFAQGMVLRALNNESKAK